MRNRRNKRKSLRMNKQVTIITCCSIFVILLVFSVIFSLINMGNQKIVNGIKIGEIDISNLTKEQATEKLEDYYKEIILKNITLYYEDLEENINIEELEPQANIDKLVEEALKVGRNGNIIIDNYNILFTMLFEKQIDISITYNEKKLDKKIEEISNKLPGAIVETNYYIENDELIIKKGTPGITIEKEKLVDLINKTIKCIDKKEINIPVKNVQIEKIDIEEIYKEIYKEAQDAYIETNPTNVHAHINGVDFAISIDEAKKVLEEAQDEYSIPLKITIPNKTLETLGKEAFPSKLSEFTTRYDASNKNRSNNLELASEKIDGTIVLPGETFSYNKIVGERTIAKGYKEAAVYSGGKVVQGIGGGICQLSSTLYNSVLYANLEVTSRSNHRFLTSYVKEGRDATVSWGTIDFCFKNTRNYPIKILSDVANGIVKVQIYGIEEETEYEVEIQTTVLETIPYKTNYINDNTLYVGDEIIEQYGSNGAKSETYKIIKQNGVIISKILLSTDTYSSLERIVRKGTKKSKQVSGDIEEYKENLTGILNDIGID